LPGAVAALSTGMRLHHRLTLPAVISRAPGGTVTTSVEYASAAPTRSSGWSASLRLMPMPALLASPPSPLPPAGQPPVPAGAPHDHRLVAQRLVALCAQVLSGSRPLSALRLLTSRTAFAQFSALHRRLSALRCEGGEVSLRLSRSGVSADAVEFVATLRAGPRVRALAMRAQPAEPTRWRLTLCQLVGG
jgi:hypothetical protein